MGKIIPFEALCEGWGVKIEGKYQGAGNVLAVEVSVRPPEPGDIIIGVVEGVDRHKNSLRVCGREFFLNDEIKIKDLGHGHTTLNALESEDVVKLKGRYSPENGFVAETVNKEKKLSFAIEKMKGKIEKIDRNTKTFLVNGITVSINEDTWIEGD